MGRLIEEVAAIDALKAAYWDKNIQSAKDDPCIVDAMTDWAIRQIKALPSAQPEIIHCEDCIYYDPPHVENDGMRLEYADLPKEAVVAGLVTCKYGINIGGRCTRDYNAGYIDDKRVYVPRDNFCGRAERRTDERFNQQTGGDFCNM